MQPKAGGKNIGPTNIRHHHTKFKYCLPLGSKLMKKYLTKSEESDAERMGDK
jgi:hypothetical protein